MRVLRRRQASIRIAQGEIGGVLRGVQVAGLEGHVSRSAVYLVHKEVRTGARRGKLERPPPGVYR